MIALLHNIRSSHNVGSIFRTADAMGVEKLYLCGITPGPLDRFGRENTNLTKVSLGAQKSVAWEHATAILSLIAELKTQDYKIIAVEQDKRALPFNQFKFQKREKYALIFGSEIEGVSPDILAQADIIMEIPMQGQKESLNVAVAFGIITVQQFN